MMTSKTPETKWYPVPCPCGRGTIPGSLYEAGKRTCGNEHAHEACTETHIGKGEWAKTHRWTEPHCVECGEPIAEEESAK